MRGIYTNIVEIRQKVFTEVARLAYEGGDYSRIINLPYKIIPGEVATYRESVFLERAIVEERLRLAIGLPLRKMTEHAPVSQGIEERPEGRHFHRGREIGDRSREMHSVRPLHFGLPLWGHHEAGAPLREGLRRRRYPHG